MGEKYVIPHVKYELGDIMDMLEDVENIWYNTGHGEKTKNIAKWKNQVFKDMINTEKRLGKKERNISSKQCWNWKNKDITIQKAGKGKITILMNKKELEELKEEFMQRAQDIRGYMHSYQI